jgi:hypothetical protein
MRKVAIYFVTTEHPTGWMNGTHEVTVVTEKNHQTNRLQKSVRIPGLGCSCDYQTPLDLVAISNLLAENGMRMVKMVQR